MRLVTSAGERAVWLERDRHGGGTASTAEKIRHPIGRQRPSRRVGAKL
jgi:hypothetical protein